MKGNQMKFFILNLHRIARIMVRNYGRRLKLDFLSAAEDLKFPKDKPSIKVGDFTYGAEHIIYRFASAGDSINIGKFCSIGRNLQIYLGGAHDMAAVSTYPFSEIFQTHLEISKEKNPSKHFHSSVDIGNDVWIGDDVCIMPGRKIGDGAVIAKGSHVVSNVEPYSVYGGNPARLIRYRFKPEVINELLEIKWWNWNLDKIKSAANILTYPPNIETLEGCSKQTN
jgi:virginiamycin A acetyltransferase